LFAAVFDLKGRDLDLRAFAGAGLIVESPSDTPQLAFVHSTESVDGEWRGTARLQERCWIAGRIRLDGRRELAARLAGRFPPDTTPGAASPTDGDLCLQAYVMWGERCVDHLAGDFAFVLWDGRDRRLIAVRDQLGVRTLFHAESGGVLIVGDSLDWIAARLPDRTLDEQWIADFLTAGFSLDAERTIYRPVRRLAPAHSFSLSRGATTVRRYWSLQVGDPLHLRNTRAYAERFREIASAAIRDRLPAGKIGISMSGGIDSTTLAACTVAAAGDAGRVVAECTYYERLMPDDEASFASLAARHLGIDLRTRAVDDLIYDPAWRERSDGGAEPTAGVIAFHPEQIMAGEQAARSPVWFFGEGPDNALVFERGAYLSWLVRRRDWGRLGAAMFRYLKAKRGRGWQETLRRYVGRNDPASAEPDSACWLDRGLAERLGQDRRLARLTVSDPHAHPWHPRAVASFASPVWNAMFDGFDRDERLAPMVWRHPYLDLRMLAFLLSVPPVPWAREKLLMREAMRGHLPAAVLARPKTPLAGTPLARAIAPYGLPPLSAGSRLGHYVDLRALPQQLPSGSALDRLISVHALDHWLAAHA
jgi:asparagine synthase (glutamine-hydrolysing)